MTTTEQPTRTVYTCQRCWRPVLAHQLHQKTYSRIESERVGSTGRLTVAVQASEVVSVTHLAPCKPEKGALS